MKENTHVIPVLKIFAKFDVRTEVENENLRSKNQGAINLLFKFFAPEFPSSINFARLARFFRIPNEI